MPDTTNNLERNPLLEIIGEINCLSLGLLWTGLTILSKDMMEFLSVGAYDSHAVTRFRQIYIKALNEDRAYWEVYGPELYRPLKNINGMPSGFAARARKGNFDISDLTQEVEDVPPGQEPIIRKWTHYPGWELSKQSGIGLSGAICHGDRPGEETVGYKTGTGTYDCEDVVDQGTSPVANTQSSSQSHNTDEVRPPSEQDLLSLKLARKILFYELEDEPYWYPLTAYIAHLLVRTGYQHYCQMPVMSSTPITDAVVGAAG